MYWLSEVKKQNQCLQLCSIFCLKHTISFLRHNFSHVVFYISNDQQWKQELITLLYYQQQKH